MRGNITRAAILQNQFTLQHTDNDTPLAELYIVSCKQIREPIAFKCFLAQVHVRPFNVTADELLVLNITYPHTKYDMHQVYYSEKKIFRLTSV